MRWVSAKVFAKSSDNNKQICNARLCRAQEVPMSIGAVSTDNISPDIAPGIRQSTAGGLSDFSGVLLKTAVNGGVVDLDAIFEAAGLRYGLSSDLLKAVAKAESGFRPDATSPAGAMGIMQLMPGTAKSLGITDPYDPEQSIMGGAKYLREMLDRFGGDVHFALAAYNAGPENVAKYGGIPPFDETQNYIKTIFEYLGGGDITAGMAVYSGSGGSKGASGSAVFNEAFTQMLLFKIIEMQMNSSKDDETKVF